MALPSWAGAAAEQDGLGCVMEEASPWTPTHSLSDPEWSPQAAGLPETEETDFISDFPSELHVRMGPGPRGRARVLTDRLTLS